VPCSCRLCNDAVGKTCEHIDEVKHPSCLQFNRSADYVIERGSGRELSQKEAIELNDLIEEAGLLHIWANNSGLTSLKVSCHCCRDCCMNYVPIDMKKLDIGIIWEKSRYQAFTDEETCSGCQVCVVRCQFDAIEMVKVAGAKKLKARVIAEKCFGCGRACWGARNRRWG